MDLDALLAPTREFGAQWSITALRDRERAPIVAHQPERLLRTASVAKVFVLLELAERLSAGDVDPARLIDRRATAPVLDSGLWRAMSVDALPVTDVALLVGAVSDNWATNALIELLGLDRIRARAARLAPAGSMLHDIVRDDRSGDVPPALSEGCAGDWASIVQRLYYANDAPSRQVLGWLAHGADLSMVAAAFDLDPLAHDTDDLGRRLWHKTGSDPGVRADVGVIRSESAVVSYAVIANWPPGEDTHGTRRAVHSALFGIGAAIMAALAER